MYCCSNTDLSGTGASVLEHRHFQITSHSLPVFSVSANTNMKFRVGSGGCCVEILKYPSVVAKVTGTYKDVIDCGVALIEAWRSNGMAKALNVDVTTLTLAIICFQKSEGGFTTMLFPRAQHANTAVNLRCLKSEFVGVLEMAGLGIFPGRLKTEMHKLLIDRIEPEGDLAHYQNWLERLSLPPKVEDSGEPTQSIESDSIVLHALTAGLEDIIESNSPFNPTDCGITAKWLDLAGLSTRESTP